ncbi:MAG: glycoside hydrolase family 31 protein, partial [bacterium]
VFVLAVALAVELMLFKSYDAYDRFYNVHSLLTGAEPSLKFWAMPAVFALYLFLFARLIMSEIPASVRRRRWLASLVVLPLTGIMTGALDVGLVLVMDNYTAGKLAGPLGLFIAAGLAAVLAASLLVSQAVAEGRGGVLFHRKLLIKIFPLALVIGVIVYSVKILSFYLVLIPFLGLALRAAFNLALTLWYFRFLGKRASLGLVTSPAQPPGPSFAYFFSFVAVIVIGMTIVVPGIPYHADAEKTPSLGMVKNLLRPVIEKRENTVLMESGELTLVVRKEPFSFVLLDKNKNVLIRLVDDEDKSGDYQGIAMNLEPKAVALSPWPGSFRTLSGKIRLSSSSFTANKLYSSENSVTAESRFGIRPVAVTFSFYDDEVLKITVEPGPPSSLRSVSMAVKAGQKERFLGIGKAGDSFNLKGKELDLLVGRRQEPSEPGFISRLTGERLEFSSGGGGPWPAPFVYFSRGIGVYMTESVDGEIEVQSRYPDAVRFASRGGPVTFFIIRKPSPLKVLEKFHHMIPPRRRLDPRILAPWLSANLSEFCDGKAESEMEALREHDIPAGNLYVHGLSVQERETGAGCTDFTKSASIAKERGFELAADDVVQLKPYGPDYREALKQGLLAKNALGLPCHFMTEQGTRSILDFTNPRTVEWRSEQWKELADMGVSAFVLDPDCILPPDAELYNNQSGYAMRNLYPEIYGRALQGSFEDEVRIASSVGYTRMETVASMAWPEHRASGTGQDTLQEEVRNGVGPAMAGVQASSAYPPSRIPAGSESQESMLLSAGLGSMFPLFFLPPELGDYSEKNSGRPIKKLAKMSRTHARLFPYFYSLADKSVREGTPVAFHLALLGGDDLFYEICDQFMLGESLLVAFPEGPGRGETTVRFPDGRWINLGDISVFKSGRHQVAFSGLRPLLFLREGHILPLFDEAFQTLSAGEDSKENHAPLDRDITINWLAGEPAGFSLFDGAGISARQSADSMVVRVSGGLARRYSLRLLDCDKPVEIRINGNSLPSSAWSYTERSRVLQVPGLKGPDLEAVMVME